MHSLDLLEVYFVLTNAQNVLFLFLFHSILIFRNYILSDIFVVLFSMNRS